MSINVKDIYNEINSFAPYDIQESYDNSGINVGSLQKEVRKILLALDVTNEVAEEAKDYDLVISHHPVIFKGLKSLDMNNPAVKLACYDTAAISMHTNFDSADTGMNNILAQKLDLNILCGLHNEHGVNSGYICELKNEMTTLQLAQHCKKNLGCKVVRFNKGKDKLKRIALCSGSGGEFLCDAVQKGCDAFITGDVKHNVFIDGENAGVAVIDAGHFYTENIFFEYLKNKLNSKFPSLEITVAESNKDIVEIC